MDFALSILGFSVSVLGVLFAKSVIQLCKHWYIGDQLSKTCPRIVSNFYISCCLNARFTIDQNMSGSEQRFEKVGYSQTKLFGLYRPTYYFAQRIYQHFMNSVPHLCKWYSTFLLYRYSWKRSSISWQHGQNAFSSCSLQNLLCLHRTTARLLLCTTCCIASVGKFTFAVVDLFIFCRIELMQSANVT